MIPPTLPLEPAWPLLGELGTLGYLFWGAGGQTVQAPTGLVYVGEEEQVRALLGVSSVSPP